MGMFDERLDNLDEQEARAKAEEKAEEAPETGEQGEPREQEELILGKFKSVDDLAKAYKELERKLGKDSEEKAALRKELEALRQLLQQGVAQQQPQQRKQETPEEWFERFYAEGPRLIQRMVEEMLAHHLAPIQQFMTQEYYNRQAQRLAAKYRDLGDYVDAMEEVFRQYPEIAAHPNGMEIAYRLAKAQRLEAELPKVTEEAREEGKKVALEKQAARLPGTSARRAEKQKSPEELIRESIFGGVEEQGIFG